MHERKPNRLKGYDYSAPGAYFVTICVHDRLKRNNVFASKMIHQSGDQGFRWQRSFHDRIVRDDNELNRIRQYIINNPMNWESVHAENDNARLINCDTGNDTIT